MLGMIAEALEFVSILRIGDPLPREVCTGEASWEPDATHLALASMRLRMQLVAWLNAGAAVDAPEMNDDALLRLADDPAMRHQMQARWPTPPRPLACANPEAVVNCSRIWHTSWRSSKRCASVCCFRFMAMAKKIATWCMPGGAMTRRWINWRRCAA